MANKKVSDKDYLFISSMLKARENRMLRRDRLEQMLSSGSFEEAARLLAEIGWPDLSGKGSAAVSEALAKRQAEIYAEITRFVPEKELVGIFRLKYDYHNAKTIVKGEGAGVDAAYLLSDAGQVEPEKLEAAFREEIETLQTASAAAREIEKVKNKFEANTLFGELNVMNKAMNLGFYEMLGDLALINREVGLYRAVGDDDIRSFSSRTFRPENSSTLIYNTKK